MKRMFLMVLLFAVAILNAQAWPASSWSAAINLTSVMSAGGVNDLSGLHFNPTNNRLYGVQNDGRLRVLQWNTVTNTFSQLASKIVGGGPEGITQANLYANEFYTIDENSYEIRRYTHTANFSSINLLRKWNLTISPSPMENTGNTGPEGIVFIPDSYLTTIGFVSQQTGLPYTSVKGLGGLFFIAHQDHGMIWVFDVNPNTDDDFAYVGKYHTAFLESCDLSFDRSTGLLYILHNIDSNKLEVTDLSTTAIAGGGRKFAITSEYDIANPGDGNINIEGFAMAPRCPGNGNVSAWLCRDVSVGEDLPILQDALRWFNPFVADGTCTPLAGSAFEANVPISVAPNPANDEIQITGSLETASVQICNSLGQIVLQKQNAISGESISVVMLQKGIYILEVESNGNISRIKWIKN